MRRNPFICAECHAFEYIYADNLDRAGTKVRLIGWQYVYPGQWYCPQCKTHLNPANIEERCYQLLASTEAALRLVAAIAANPAPRDALATLSVYGIVKSGAMNIILETVKLLSKVQQPVH
ncbi:MAG: hypothetical protein ACXWQ5_00340 [Ktedonobacterales bacterium]